MDKAYGSTLSALRFSLYEYESRGASPLCFETFRLVPASSQVHVPFSHLRPLPALDKNGRQWLKNARVSKHVNIFGFCWLVLYLVRTAAQYRCGYNSISRPRGPVHLIHDACAGLLTQEPLQVPGAVCAIQRAPSQLAHDLTLPRHGLW
jgi:hypothetical protein